MDIWDKNKRSAVMAKIKSKDTKPELIVRRYLYSRGYRYRKNVKGLPGTPDVVLRKYGLVYMVVFGMGTKWIVIFLTPIVISGRRKSCGTNNVTNGTDKL